MSIEAARPIVALSAVAWLAFGLVLRNSSKRVAIAVVGVLWSLVGILAIDLLASKFDWWHYVGEAPRFGETPVDVLLVWAILWGGLPLVVMDIVRPLVTGAAFLVIDLIVVPQLSSVVLVGSGWWIGELVLVAVIAIPGLHLVRWMQTGQRLAARTAMLVGLFTAFTLWIAPFLGSELTGVPVHSPWSGRGWMIWLQAIAIPAILGVAAVDELARRGGGTPYPWDPPKRVVASGPYAYVTNPMQLSMVLMLPVLAVALWHWPTLVASAVVMAFAVGVAHPHEELQLQERWGSEWVDYRDRHRAWIPRWRPQFPSGTTATLYVDFDCGTCMELASWLTAKEPVALRIMPATMFPGPALHRVTYQSGDIERDGVHAVATALEHLNFGWAFVGWFLRMPGIRQLAELISDVSGNTAHKAGIEACAPVEHTHG